MQHELCLATSRCGTKSCNDRKRAQQTATRCQRATLLQLSNPLRHIPRLCLLLKLGVLLTKLGLGVFQRPVHPWGLLYTVVFSRQKEQPQQHLLAGHQRLRHAVRRGVYAADVICIMGPPRNRQHIQLALQHGLSATQEPRPCLHNRGKKRHVPPLSLENRTEVLNPSSQVQRVAIQKRRVLQYCFPYIQSRQALL